MMSNNFTSHVLDNGLTVLLQENHSAPIISHWIWYRVGSRNEVPGKTGVSHFLEHMLFKGTKQHPGAETQWELSRNGGIQNGTTNFDWTSYDVTMPANRIGIALEMEADRMVNTIFDPQEIEPERTVILSEKAWHDTSSSYRLTKSLHKAAFPNHPYGRDVIGEEADIQAITCDDLYEHYYAWYAPNNAVVTAAGDFKTEEMLPLIEAAYSSIPARSIPTGSIAPDAPIFEALPVKEEVISDINDLQIGWGIPGAKDPDIPALILLDIILNGAGFENVYDRSTLSNRTSLLYRKLVREGMAADVKGFYIPTRDPFLYRIAVDCNTGINTEEVREIIFEELEHISRSGVLPDEMEKAKKQAKALYAYTAEDAANQAFWLGHSSMFADPCWYNDYLQHLERVSLEDISRIAGSMLSRDRSITGVCVKQEEKQ